jgi:hypothetical protein
MYPGGVAGLYLEFRDFSQRFVPSEMTVAIT